MKETGIIMSGNHPKLVLDGAKTQTRRTSGLEDVNKYPWPLEYKGLLPSTYYLKKSYHKDYALNPQRYHWFLGKQNYELNPIPVKCPYGQVGDRLWVRETFKHQEIYIIYKADNAIKTVNYNFGRPIVDKWRSSRYMPRWASRILLEITEIRVERVQDIIQSDNDMRAEGIPLITFDNNRTDWGEMAMKFAELWDSLNAKRGYGWAVNPWVWVVNFKEIK